MPAASTAAAAAAAADANDAVSLLHGGLMQLAAVAPRCSELLVPLPAELAPLDGLPDDEEEDEGGAEDGSLLLGHEGETMTAATVQWS